MSFFQDLFKNAKTIVNGGVDVLRDQLSSTYEVNKDAQGVPQVTNDSSIKVGPVSLPAPKAVTTARKIFIGENAQERLDRIQNERQQSLIPSAAEKAVREDFAREGLLASGGLDKTTGAYDPSRVNAVGIPMGPAATIKKKLASEAADIIASGEKSVLRRLTGQDVATNVPKVQRTLSKRAAALAPDVPNEVTDVNKYISDNIAKREAARGSSSFNTKLRNIVNESENKLVDFAMPIEKALQKGKSTDSAFSKFLETNPSKNIHNQIDRVLRTPNLASSFIRDGGLDKVIQQVDNLDHLDEYLVAKHTLDVGARDIKTGRSLSTDTALVKELGPKYEQSAQVVSEYSKKLLDYATESGLISSKTNAILKERYPNYVPLKRIFSETEKDNAFRTTKAVASLGRQSVVQNLIGSERQIESPMRSLIEQTNHAFQQGEKNRAAQIITSYKDVKGNPFGLRQVSSTDEVASDMSHISVLRDGKKEVWEVPKDIERAAKMLNVEQLNILGKIVAAPLRVARAGITGINPSFVMANVVKDQVGSFIFADHGLRASIANPVNFMKSFWGAVGHGELYDEWVRAGGGGTGFDMGRDQVAQTVERIRAGKSAKSKVLYTVTHPSELLRAVEDVIGRSEELTRMQQYAAHRDVALAKGLSAEESRAAGAAASRENSTNFARRGEWGTVLNSTFLYLNAGIQGSRLLVRSLKNKPAQTSAKIATTILFPAAVLTHWNLSDPSRKKAYEDIQDYEKNNNLIIVPPNPTQDKDGRWNVIKIPLQAGVGQLANPVRRATEASQGLDPVKFSQIASSLINTISPIDTGSPISSITPQILKPTLQAYANKDFYTGKPIVYPSEQRLPTEAQVRKNTSGTAKAVADTLGVSPIKTEKFIRDTGGGVSANVLNTLDKVFTPNQVGGVSVSDSISRRFSSAAGNKISQEAQNKAYQALDKQDAERELLSKKAQDVAAEVASLPPAEAKNRLKEIASTDMPLFKKVMQIKKEDIMGLTAEDKAVLRLGVENGARARFIHDKFIGLKSQDPQAAKAYIIDMRNKKLLTDDVFIQLTKLN